MPRRGGAFLLAGTQFLERLPVGDLGTVHFDFDPTIGLKTAQTFSATG
jgi:hypothetical protein